MKTLALLPFRLGQGAALPLSEAQCEFYCEVAESLVGEKCQTVQAHPIPTIAIDSDTLNRTKVSDGSGDGTTVHAQQVNLDSVFETIESLDPVPQIVLIDLDVFVGADLRGVAYLQLASAIASTLASLEDRNKPTELMIVMLPEIQTHRSAFQKLLHGYFADRKVVLLADNGETLPGETDIRNLDRTKYPTRLGVVRGKPIDLLDRKLIRQLGHFKRGHDGQHEECVPSVLRWNAV